MSGDTTSTIASAAPATCTRGRFKSFPVAEDDYFLTLCRYVEANPVRAKLVERAEQWPWSGLWCREHGG